MCEVHHIHQPENQAEPGGHQRVNQPHQQAARGDLQNLGNRHRAHTNQFASITASSNGHTVR